VTLQERNPSFIQAEDGIKLAYYPFLGQKNPKDIVIFFHGVSSYANKTYQNIGNSLIKNNKNIGCYLVDIRGHGRSEGERGDTPSVKQALCDVNSMINYVRSTHPDARIFLAGHSAGSGLILNWLTWSEHVEVDGYIFIAPFLGRNSGTLYEPQDPKQQLTKKVNIWAFIIHKLTLGFFGGNWKAIWFNHSEKKYKQSPLIVDYYTVNMLNVISLHDPVAAFAAIDKPFVIAIGDQDERFDHDKVLGFAAHATKVKNQATTLLLPGVNHSSIIFKTSNIIEKFVKEIDIF
jgi:alpha-beta hydrolase superfamily lysophospholipase